MTTFIEGAASGGSGGTLGASYNSTLPTYTNGQTSTLQTDSRGQLLIGTLPTGANAIGAIVGQRPFEAILTLTRPANTTAYAAGQVLSTATSALTAFPTLALGIGNSQRYTVNALTIISSNGAASTKGQFAAYLFNTASPSGGGFNDAASFAPTAAALAASGVVLVGSVPSSLAQAGTAAYGVEAVGIALQGATDSSGNVYPAVVLTNAYTPASAETIYLKVTGVY